MQYRKEIDGLRAVAVLPVILFHAGFSIFRGGFVGVDVFFVISGYLITSILINDIQQGQFSIARFYERRARRILPALFLVLFVCLPFAWMWMAPMALQDFAQSLIAVVFFASNILFWSEEGYFAPAAELKPLLHTWSLAVEEQYYLLFPLFLFVMWRFGRNRTFWSIVVIATLSLVLSEWGWRHKPSANFYLAPTRAWELLVGSLAAFYSVDRPQRSNNFLSAFGLALILFSIFVYDTGTPFPSIYALVPVGGAALIILFAGHQTWTARLLSAPPFLWVGVISYSAYLWHQPLFAFARLHSATEPPKVEMLGLAVASLLLAWASWRWVETPFRRRKYPFLSRRKGIFAASGVVGAIFVVVGAFGWLSNGFPSRMSLVANVDASQISLPNIDRGFCFYDFNTHSELPVIAQIPNCHLGPDNGSNRVLLFGDSFAAQWEPFFALLAKDKDLRVDVVTTNWCFPSDRADYTAPNGHISISQCEINRRFLMEHAKDYRTVILGGQWGAVFGRGFSDGLVSLVRHILTATDANVIVMDTPPQYSRVSVEDAFYSTSQKLIFSDNNAASSKFWVELTNTLHGIERVTLLNRGFFGARFSTLGRSSTGFPYSLDGGHISVYGAQMLYRENSDDCVGEMRRLLVAPVASSHVVRRH